MPVIYLLPSDIRFTQDSIKSQFRDGTLVIDTFKLLLYDKMHIDDIRPLHVVHRYGKNYYVVQGNRRLFIFRELEAAGKIKEIRVKKGKVRLHKFNRMHTTHNQGKSVVCRNDSELQAKMRLLSTTWLIMEKLQLQYGYIPRSIFPAGPSNMSRSYALQNVRQPEYEHNLNYHNTPRYTTQHQHIGESIDTRFPMQYQNIRQHQSISEINSSISTVHSSNTTHNISQRSNVAVNIISQSTVNYPSTSQNTSRSQHPNVAVNIVSPSTMHSHRTLQYTSKPPNVDHKAVKQTSVHSSSTSFISERKIVNQEVNNPGYVYNGDNTNTRSHSQYVVDTVNRTTSEDSSSRTSIEHTTWQNQLLNQTYRQNNNYSNTSKFHTPNQSISTVGNTTGNIFTAPKMSSYTSRHMSSQDTFVSDISTFENWRNNYSDNRRFLGSSKYNRPYRSIANLEESLNGIMDGNTSCCGSCTIL